MRLNTLQSVHFLISVRGVSVDVYLYRLQQVASVGLSQYIYFLRFPQWLFNPF